MRADGVQHARAAGVAEVHRQVLRLARLQPHLGQFNSHFGQFKSSPGLA